MWKWLERWLVDIGPNRDAHNERIKLIAVSANAAGIASLIGGVLAPMLDPTRQIRPVTAFLGIVLWAGFLLAALALLGYIRSKD